MVASVEGVPCEGAHDAHVFAEASVADGDSFPGKEAMESTASEQCIAKWDAALGAYDPAENLDLTYFTPTKESWEGEDDREVTCFVVAADGAPLTGSKLL
ncbi:MAG: septum formation family protein [Acidimicrobiales bacterium]